MAWTPLPEVPGAPLTPGLALVALPVVTPVQLLVDPHLSPGSTLPSHRVLRPSPSAVPTVEADFCRNLDLSLLYVCPWPPEPSRALTRESAGVWASSWGLCSASWGPLHSPRPPLASPSTIRRPAGWSLSTAPEPLLQALVFSIILGIITEEEVEARAIC